MSEGDYDASDSLDVTGMMARDAAGDLEDAILALDAARVNAYENREEIDELIKLVGEMRDRYRLIGAAL